MKIELDKTDKILIQALQENADVSVAALAEKVNLTTTPCWKRIKRLEDAGVIRKRVALIDPDSVGLAFTAFVHIKTNDHSEAWYRKFAQTASQFPEIMEFYRMAGEYDYMMKVQVADMPAFDHFYKKLVNSVPSLNNVTSTFAMEALKYTTALPVR